MESFFAKLAEAEKGTAPAAFCVVVRTTGSTPRKAGSKMIVYSDKSIYGTVGGGGIEKQVIEEAVSIMAGGVGQLRSYNLEADLGMVCGGSADVYIEPVRPLSKLYIFGAGHVGRCVAKYAQDFGFAVTLFDEREELFADLEVPGARLILGDFVKSIAAMPFDTDTYSVIVTPKHLRDETVLRAVGLRPGAYVGMIGSRRKVATVRESVLADGALSAEAFDAVDAPIGLKFAAETPEEIGISVVAKLIDRKNTLAGREKR